MRRRDDGARRHKDAEAEGADQEEDVALPELQVGIDSFPPKKIVRTGCAEKGKSVALGPGTD